MPDHRTYNHIWAEPFVVRIVERDGPFTNGYYTLRQLCKRCQTMRNPETRQVLVSRGLVLAGGLHECQAASPELQVERWPDRVLEEIEVLKSAGEDVRLDDRRVKLT